MGSRTTLLFALVVLLGAVATVSPALANASEVKLEVAQNCHLPNWPCWNPMGNPESNVPESEVPSFKITQGGMISFEDNDSNAPTDVLWKSAAPSSCTPAVPSTPETGWKSTCTFAADGEYEFESQDLFKVGYSNYTKYKVVVAGTPTDAPASASGETQTEATLNGSIDPKGNTVEYHFEYEGPGVPGGKQSTPTATLSAADFASDPVSAPVTGLQPDMTYHFLLVATYGVGKTSVSGATEKMFTTHAVTAPTATTLAAEGLKETEATLNGKVDPEGGAEAEYFFEWGAGSSGAYEHITKAVSLPSDGAEHQASATVTGLTPGSEYHFRLVAKNKLGSVQGNDLKFMAVPTPPSNTPSPISSPVGGNPIATTSTTPTTSSQGATTGSQAAPPTHPSTVKKTKPLTQAQKLAIALKQCKKQPKKKRAQCETKVRKLYAPKHRSHKK